MSDLIRVLVLGTGQMGAAIARLILQKNGIKLVGAYGRRSHRAGMDLGQAIGLERDLGLAIFGNLKSAVEQTRPHLAIQATCSRVEDGFSELQVLLQQGVEVISIAEEMVFPACSSPELANEIDQLARLQGVSVVGTGINPGFVLDLLVITLTGVCAHVDSITAERVNDLSPYGPTVISSQGVGLTLQTFAEGVAAGRVVGHYGFPESIHLICKALGWEPEKIEQSREPIISSVRRETPFITVEPGQVAGCHQRAVAYYQGRPVINFDHPQQVFPELEGVETGDTIEIRGIPSFSVRCRPEIPGGQATAALAVNTIPRLLKAPPGLHTVLDLPVATAMLADVRELLRVPLASGDHG